MEYDGGPILIEMDELPLLQLGNSNLKNGKQRYWISKTKRNEK